MRVQNWLKTAQGVGALYALSSRVYQKYSTASPASTTFINPGVSTLSKEKMAYSYTKTRNKRKKNRQKKKLYYKKKMVKKMVRRQENRDAIAQRWNLKTVNRNFTINADPTGQAELTGNSNLTFYEVGLSRVANTQAFTDYLPNFIRYPLNSVSENGVDDITYMIGQAMDIWSATTDPTAGPTYETVSEMNQKMFVQTCRAEFLIRNNSNVGCIVRTYYVVPRRDIHHTTQTNLNMTVQGRLQYYMDRDVDPLPPIGRVQRRQLGFSRTLFDYPTVCSNFILKPMKPFILYPGQTIRQRLVSPIEGKIVKLNSTMEQSSNRRYHRAICWQVCGLPAHSDDIVENFDYSVNVTTAPFSLDVTCEHTCKFNEVSEPQDKNRVLNKRTDVTTVPNPIIHPATNPVQVVVSNTT